MNTIQTASPPPKVIQCPFVILTDTREQQKYLLDNVWEHPTEGEELPEVEDESQYTFENLWDGPVGRSKLIKVTIEPATVPVGDYSIKGMPEIAIERKSKSDLWGSISQRRENFVERLEKMSRTLNFAAVVVEADWLEILTDPPRHTKYPSKSIARTIMAWMTRYPVHWIMAPTRAHAEQFTFRLLQRYWLDQQESPRERFHSGLLDKPLPDPAEGEES